MARRRRFIVRDRRRLLLRLGLVLGALALVGLGVWALVRLLKPDDKIAVKEVAFSKTDPHTYTGSGVLYLEGGRLFYADDTDGKKDYSKAVQTAGAAPSLVGSANIHVLYNQTSARIIGVDAPIERGSIDRVLCGSDHIAIFSANDAGEESIGVYDKNAQLVDEIDCTAACLTQLGMDMTAEETLWTLGLDLRGGVPISTVTTYNLAQAVTNGLITVYTELVEDVRFTGNSIFVAGTDHIFRYARTDSSEVYRVLVYGWRVMDFQAGQTPLFLLRPRAEDTLRSVRICALAEGEQAQAKTTTVQLPDGTLGAFLCGERLAAVTPEALYLYDTAGKAAAPQTLGVRVESVEKLSAHRLLLAGEDGIMYTLDVK